MADETVPDARGRSDLHWVPLECNPDAFNKFLQKLGVTEARFTDVWSLDDEMLSFVPQPVLALILLCPYTEKMRSRPGAASAKPGPALFFKQTISNACGAMAIIHATVNNMDRLDGPMLSELYNRTNKLEPQQRGEVMESWEELAKLHRESSQVGQTEAPAADAKIDQHFLAFIVRDGELLELDGTLAGPINHGKTDDIVKSCAKVIKSYMALEPESILFTTMALTSGAVGQ